jgi:hypothetical protein
MQKSPQEGQSLSGSCACHSFEMDWNWARIGTAYKEFVQKLNKPGVNISVKGVWMAVTALPICIASAGNF